MIHHVIIRYREKIEGPYPAEQVLFVLKSVAWENSRHLAMLARDPEILGEGAGNLSLVIIFWLPSTLGQFESPNRSHSKIRLLCRQEGPTTRDFHSWNVYSWKRVQLFWSESGLGFITSIIFIYFPKKNHCCHNLHFWLVFRIKLSFIDN